jgi:hypothetical protein
MVFEGRFTLLGTGDSTMKRTISGILVATLACGVLPLWAAENENATHLSGPVAPATFRLAVEHAALTAIVDGAAGPAVQLQRASHLSESAVSSGQERRSAQARAAAGSGGGHTAAIVKLVTVVGGLVGTAYMIKAMKKQAEAMQGQIARP